MMPGIFRPWVLVARKSVTYFTSSRVARGSGRDVYTAPERGRCVVTQRFHAVQPKLVDGSRAIRFDGTDAERQALGDFVIAVPLAEQIEDLPLAFAQVMPAHGRDIPSRGGERRCGHRAEVSAALQHLLDRPGQLAGNFALADVAHGAAVENLADRGHVFKHRVDKHWDAVPGQFADQRKPSFRSQMQIKDGDVALPSRQEGVRFGVIAGLAADPVSCLCQQQGQALADGRMVVDQEHRRCR